MVYSTFILGYTIRPTSAFLGGLIKTLFDIMEGNTALQPERIRSWVPPEPPNLGGIKTMAFDTETTGLRWFDRDRPVGLSFCLPDKRTFYLPWGHRGGGNLDEATVKRWAKRELRGLRLIGLNIRFDIHMMREWGVDLEEQGCTVSDVGHSAALLDDHRRSFSLENLGQDFLGVGKVKGLVGERIADYHAGEVAAYAEQDARLTYQLEDYTAPYLEKEDLLRVKALEDKVIYVVCEMEKNGSPIDMGLLERWVKESQERVEAGLIQLAREVGFQVNPDSPKDQERVFHRLGVDVVRTEKGRASFTDALLKRIEHPTIQLMRQVGKMMSLRSKFIVNTKECIGPDGIFRYALHQLRAEKDENSGGEAGTVTGRFSSSALLPHVGGNIQQRSKPAKQRVSFGYAEDDASHDDEIFLVRKLHVPKSGLLLASDMMQVEYRIFADYGGNPAVIQAYRDNPLLSFHRYMHAELRKHREITYGRTKDVNFAKIYGARYKKLAVMLGYITEEEYFTLVKEKARDNHPLLREVVEVDKVYKQVLPEADDLLKKAAHLAMPVCDRHCDRTDELHQHFPHRGYVRTMMGRRSRFPRGERIHKALNSIIQGSAADVMKMKLVQLHEHRHETGFLLRATIHDEVLGDVPDKAAADRVTTLLNDQSIYKGAFQIPLLWETGIGPNWAECK